MMNNFKKVANNITYPLLEGLPLFCFSFILLYPSWIGTLKQENIRALKYFFEVDNIVSCDLYFTIFFSWFIAFVPRFLSKRISKIYKIFIILLLGSAFVIRRFLIEELSSDFSPEIFLLLVETNRDECSAFWNTYVYNMSGLKYMLMIIVIITLYITTEWGNNKIKLKASLEKKTRVTTLFITLMLFVNGTFSFPYLTELMGMIGQNSVTGIIGSMNAVNSPLHAAKFYDNINEILDNGDDLVCKEDSLNVIFVVGESLNKYHTSLYGYYLQTTPLMNNSDWGGQNIIFNDVISVSMYTSLSLRNFFCLNDFSNSEEWYESIYWPALFKKAGYTVSMWDNQRSEDLENRGSFNEMFSKSALRCYDHTSKCDFEFDGDLIDDYFKRKISSANKRNFVYFHLKGQHFPIEGKCPKEKIVFDESDVNNNKSFITREMKNEIALYDNAVHYTDEVIAEIIKKFKDNNSILVFISDHGEEVYDYRPKSFRPPMEKGFESEYAHSQHDIPLYIWASQKYKERHSNLIKELESAKNKPYSLDKIGYLMLRLGFIDDCEYYNPQKDISNSNYKISKRTIKLKGGNTLIYEDLTK